MLLEARGPEELSTIAGAVGFGGAWVMRRVALPSSGLYPIAVMAIAVMAYAAGAMAHGSGFSATPWSAFFAACEETQTVARSG